jgi:hypothetical protein
MEASPPRVMSRRDTTDLVSEFVFDVSVQGSFVVIAFPFQLSVSRVCSRQKPAIDFFASLAELGVARTIFHGTELRESTFLVDAAADHINIGLDHLCFAQFNPDWRMIAGVRLTPF